jgi:AcrR family transcriptional regulator
VIGQARGGPHDDGLGQVTGPLIDTPPVGAAPSKTRARSASATGRVAGDSRSRILDAALELMAEQGYSGTSISMVCRRSGLPPSSTYWHFGNKEGLLAATVEHGAGQWLAAMPRWEQLEGSAEDRLRAMLQNAAASLADRPAFMRILILLPLEREMDQQSLDLVRTVRHRAAAGFRHAFRELLDRTDVDGGPAETYCADLARFALSVVDGAFVAYEIDRDAAQLSRNFDLLASAFLDLARRFVSEEAATPVL